MSWPTVAIGEIACLLRNGMSIKQSPGAGGIPITRIESIASGSINISRCGYADLERRDCSGWLLEHGDILISHINSLAHLGKCAIFEDQSCEVAHRMNLLNLRVDQSVALPRFILHALRSKRFVEQISTIAKKSVNQASFNISTFKELEIPLPPLEEQRRIAAILDKVHYIHGLAAEKAKISAHSLYRSLLTQEIEQPEADWVKLGDVLEIARGGSPRPIQAFLTDDPNGINWIMIGDAGVGEKYITKTAKKIRTEGLSKTRLVKEGDLLLSNSMSFGRPYIMKTDGAIHDGWLVLRDAHAICSPDYLYHVLGSPACYAQFTRAAAGATVKNLNTSIVSSVEIPLPPLEKQVKIAERLDAVEIHVGRRFALLAVKAEQLRSSLTSSLFQVAS